MVKTNAYACFLDNGEKKWKLGRPDNGVTTPPPENKLTCLFPMHLFSTLLLYPPKVF